MFRLGPIGVILLIDLVCFFFLIEDKGANPKKGTMTMLGVGPPIGEKK
jgi:hypothetical protein